TWLEREADRLAPYRVAEFAATEHRHKAFWRSERLIFAVSSLIQSIKSDYKKRDVHVSSLENEWRISREVFLISREVFLNERHTGHKNYRRRRPYYGRYRGDHRPHGIALSGNRRAQRRGLSAFRSSSQRTRRGNAAPARPAPGSGSQGLARLSRRCRPRIGRTLS